MTLLLNHLRRVLAHPRSSLSVPHRWVKGVVLIVCLVQVSTLCAQDVTPAIQCPLTPVRAMNPADLVDILGVLPDARIVAIGVACGVAATDDELMALRERFPEQALPLQQIALLRRRPESPAGTVSNAASAEEARVTPVERPETAVPTAVTPVERPETAVPTAVTPVERPETAVPTARPVDNVASRVGVTPKGVSSRSRRAPLLLLVAGLGAGAASGALAVAQDGKIKQAVDTMKGVSAGPGATVRFNAALDDAKAAESSRNMYRAVAMGGGVVAAIALVMRVAGGRGSSAPSVGAKIRIDMQPRRSGMIVGMSRQW